MKILLVEDDSNVSWIVVTMLRNHGHAVVVADSPKSAARALSYSKTFDRVLTDFQMPLSGGIEVIKMAKEACPETKVCLMSGQLDDTLKKMAEEAGADCTIAKPFAFAELRKVLDI
jgi:DNA-binding response OmpR family regulator